MRKPVPICSQKQLLRDRGICVVIPTYNNAGTIEAVVRQTLNECMDVIVVNDGSTDGTSDILHAIEGITIVEYARNRGKGHALKCGFKRALEMGFAYAITLDGDGQHYPHNIGLFLEANQRHPGALIMGSRQMDGVERSKGSRFANRFSNFWFCVQTGRHLPDTQTGYRLYPLKKLYGLDLLTSRYEAELELLVFASWHGVKIVSVPVNVYYPAPEERVSHFRPAKDFTRISILNTVLCFLAIVYGLPLRIYRGVMITLRTIYSFLFFLIFSMFIMTPITVVYLKIGKITDKKRYHLHCILNFMARFVLKIHGIPGVKFSIANPHNEDFEKPAVIICNHQSHLDLMTMLIQTRKLVVLTNDWVWNSPYYSYVIHKAEFYPVSAGVDTIMPKLKNLVERGYSIAVYPEGTRSVDCSIGRFHQGAFHIAHTLGLDIVPLVLYGAGKALPKKDMHLTKWPIRIEIDKRITPSEFNTFGDTLKQQASYMRQYYKKRYWEIANKIEQDV